MDYFQYSGPIERRYDIDFIECVSAGLSSESCTVIMTSGGGDPDAAYKMCRYLHHKYESLTVVVPGFCKSAATLFAIGAKEVVFAPYGELGPLDIQLRKEDSLSDQESGLNISEALSTLEDSAVKMFHRLVDEIIMKSRGAISFKTAAEDAIGMIRALYEPVFAQFKPEEVGIRTRGMKIGVQYAQRLNAKFNNLTAKGEQFLALAYPSHSFVIDFLEAHVLFNNVRLVSEAEMRLVDKIGPTCRMPPSEPIIQKLDSGADNENEDDVEPNDQKSKPSADTRKEASSENAQSSE